MVPVPKYKVSTLYSDTKEGMLFAFRFCRHWFPGTKHGQPLTYRLDKDAEPSAIDWWLSCWLSGNLFQLILLNQTNECNEKNKEFQPDSPYDLLKNSLPTSSSLQRSRTYLTILFFSLCKDIYNLVEMHYGSWWRQASYGYGIKLFKGDVIISKPIETSGKSRIFAWLCFLLSTWQRSSPYCLFYWAVQIALDLRPDRKLLTLFSGKNVCSVKLPISFTLISRTQ